MPIEFRTIQTENLRVTTFSGTISEADLAQYVTQLRDGFDPNMNSLIEMEATHLEISAEAVRTLAGSTMELPDVSAERRVAILAPDDLTYGFGRMYEAVYHGLATVQVFRDRDAAMQWVTSGMPRH